MALYVVTFYKPRHDEICETMDAARQVAWDSHDPFWSIYLAPDKDKKWRTGYPADGATVWVLLNNKPQRMQYHSIGTAGVYRFCDHLDTDTREFVSVHKTDGWLPLEWFRDVAADDEDMRQWQEEDEYGDRGDYCDYGDPNEI